MRRRNKWKTLAMERLQAQILRAGKAATTKSQQRAAGGVREGTARRQRGQESNTLRRRVNEHPVDGACRAEPRYFELGKAKHSRALSQTPNCIQANARRPHLGNPSTRPCTSISGWEGPCGLEEPCDAREEPERGLFGPRGALQGPEGRAPCGPPSQPSPLVRGHRRVRTSQFTTYAAAALRSKAPAAVLCAAPLTVPSVVPSSGASVVPWLREDIGESRRQGAHAAQSHDLRPPSRTPLAQRATRARCAAPPHRRGARDSAAGGGSRRGKRCAPPGDVPHTPMSSLNGHGGGGRSRWWTRQTRRRGQSASRRGAPGAPAGRARAATRRRSRCHRWCRRRGHPGGRHVASGRTA